MKRREFIGLVGGAAAWPLTGSAQQARGKIITIGILAIEPWSPIDTFRTALDDLGYIEGKNVRFNVDVVLTLGDRRRTRREAGHHHDIHRHR
jgi:putative tryptophan/tyrosine transport system substrate-binding protein